MLNILLQLFIWIFWIYGLLCFINDCILEKFSKNLENNVSCIVIAKDAENEIEEYIRKIKCINNNVVAIDLKSKDDTLKILEKLENENVNLKILDINEGQEYLNELLNSV